MKKLGIVIILLGVSSTVFAEWLGDAYVKIWPNRPVYDYAFFSIDLNDVLDVLMLGNFISIYHDTHPLNKSGYIYVTRIVMDNTELAQTVKDKMKQRGANVCMSITDGDYVVVNLLMPNGKYTTIFLKPSERAEFLTGDFPGKAVGVKNLVE